VNAFALELSYQTGTFRLDAAFAADGGITVLFGPSGSGKSLTLALIAGLLRPDRGSIAINGDVVAAPDRGLHVRTQDRRVGLVFQEANLLPHRSALDNVALAVRECKNRHERRHAAHEWLSRVGADQLATARPRTLSGGERQRVALARALATRPQVMLLDEPFSALDLPTRRQLRGLLVDVTRTERIPTLIVTHDLSEAKELADRIVLFEPGRTLGVIDPHELPGDEGPTWLQAAL
jgi:molybdate transport system ATP-binding protein